MASQPISRIEDRAERRDEVYLRTRVTLPDRRSVSATLVNLSPHGMMVRAEAEVSVGERITVTLPVIGAAAAVIRWTLGGRLGCQFERAIEDALYPVVRIAAGG